MDLGLNTAEGKALHCLFERSSSDVMVKLDLNGFIINASSNIDQLGPDFSAQLLMPHVCDLADAEFGEVLSDYVEQVMDGKPCDDAVEFTLAYMGEPSSADLVPDNTSASSPVEAARHAANKRWYSLSLRPVFDDHNVATGALGLLRSIDDRRQLEGELHSRAVTDPLTGLYNRHVFCANMRRQLAKGAPRIVMVFAVDRMRAMLLQYGQRTSDEIQWGFAKFLEAMIKPDFELAQFDNERFAVMAPDLSIEEARAWASEVLDTFSSIAITSSPRAPQLSASAGLARLEATVDWTLRQAELALVIAQAGGGMQVGQCDYQAPPTKRSALG